ncbi:unnamed protein product [Ectocarpus sp. CCAP 1310/34]|nr:unnamed protein product [Ectocarpus sp. CCAP 1310/34]
MKTLHKLTLWSRRSSKSSKSKIPPSVEPAQADETPVQVAHNTILFVDGREGSNNFSRFGQTLAYRNQEEEEEKTTVDSSHRAYGAKEFVSDEECRGEECPNVRLLRKQELLRKSDQEEIQKLRATLLQQKYDLQRNEKMALARLKAVEDEKAALEVALGAERANTAMQQITMNNMKNTLREKTIEAQLLESELGEQVEMLKKEKSKAAENGQRQTKQEKIRSGLARLVEKDLRTQVATLEQSIKELSQAAEDGQRQTKEEKVRNGLTRLVEKDLRKQVASLQQSRRQQADEIRNLLAQVQDLQRSEERHIDSVVTFGRTQGFNATASALGDGHPDCPRLHADFYPFWEAPVEVAIVGIFRITVPAGVRDKHLSYVRSHGNVVQRFHGTSCRSACNFILDPKKAAPCGLQDCNVCNICLQGFKIGKSSTRYGQGVYFSKQATKANSYAGGSEKQENGKKLRCIFVADVAKGRYFVTKKTGFDGARYPPEGHDSVQGEVGNGLDCEELVVYHEEAAIPTHLIVYTVRRRKHPRSASASARRKQRSPRARRERIGEAAGGGKKRRPDTAVEASRAAKAALAANDVPN